MLNILFLLLFNALFNMLVGNATLYGMQLAMNREVLRTCLHLIGDALARLLWFHQYYKQSHPLSCLLFQASEKEVVQVDGVSNRVGLLKS